MISTAHSEFGFLEKVILKSVKNSFKNQEILNRQWKDHNFIHVPDFSVAEGEYAVFRNILEQNGTTVLEFPADETTSIDSVYCRDASIQTDSGVILCTMGKQLRKSEPMACEKYYRSIGATVLGSIVWPGTVEGGDVAWIDERTLAVANAYRTNPEGIAQLKNFLKPQEVEVVTVDLPHYRGPGDVFHLMSIISPVDRDLAVVYSPLMPVSFRNYLLGKGIQLVEVPDQEFDSLGCNVLAIAPRKCIIEESNQVTIQRLREAGAEVISFSGKHLCVPGGGGPTCLTRPVSRLI